MQHQSATVQSLDGCRVHLRCCKVLPSLDMLHKKVQSLCCSARTDHVLLLEQPSLLKPPARAPCQTTQSGRHWGCLKPFHLFEKLALLCRQMARPTASTILTGVGLSCLSALLLCLSCWGSCSLQTIPASGAFMTPPVMQETTACQTARHREALEAVPASWGLHGGHARGHPRHMGAFRARCCGFTHSTAASQVPHRLQGSRQHSDCSTSAEPACTCDT